jgi:peptide/nickel transport system substrate-binding protein/oligopeptide transport system substrate-binding protein
VIGGRQWLRINEVVQAMLREGGFKGRIRQMDEAAFYATRSTWICRLMSGMSADFNYPDNFSIHSSLRETPSLARSTTRAMRCSMRSKRAFPFRSRRALRALHKVGAGDRSNRRGVGAHFSQEHVYVSSRGSNNFVAPWNGGAICLTMVYVWRLKHKGRWNI